MTTSTPPATSSPAPASPAARADALRDPVPDAVERLAAATAAVVLRRRTASGLVWRPGVVLTSAAALWRASRIELVLPGGESVEGQLRGADAGTDIAAITYEVPASVAAAVGAGSDAPMPPAAPAARDEAVRVGDFVFAVGRAAGGGVHASFGRIGATGGAWRSWRGGQVERLLRLDGGLYDGLAGAPVGDAAGHWLGLASPAFSRQHGVVLPPETVARVAAALLAQGHLPQRHLGIAVQPVRAVLGPEATDGLLVSSVAEGSPAAAAGVWVGDVIVAAGGQPTAHPGELRAAIDACADANLPLVLSRGGQRLEIAPALVERAERAERRCH